MAEKTTKKGKESKFTGRLKVSKALESQAVTLTVLICFVFLFGLLKSYDKKT